MIHAIVLSVITASISVSIVEPVDGGTYDGDWLPFRVIVENENELPDSVHYTLNGSPVVQIPRLNTDWYTYMANDCRLGYSEAPAPHDNTVLWTAPVTGTGHEFVSPVVVDGRVYHASEEQEIAFCLDAATGAEIWRLENIGDPIDDALHVTGGRAYLASDSIWCLDALTGQVIWSFANCDQPSFNGPPTVYEDRVIVWDWTEYKVYALDIETGDVLWCNPEPASCFSTLTAYNGLVFVPTGDGQVYALSTETGSNQWVAEGFGTFWDSSPTVVDGEIYIGDCDGNLYRIDAQTGTSLDTFFWPPYQRIESTPAIHEDAVFFGLDDYVVSIDGFSGIPHWQYEIENDYLHASLGVADGLVFWGDLDCNPKDSTVLIHAVDEETGSEVWSYQINDAWKGVLSSPAIVDGIVYIGAGDGFLYAFGTGMKYTYEEDFFYADVGPNELIVTSWDDGLAVSADTVSFTVTQTGITLEPSTQLSLRATPNPIQTTATLSFFLEEPGLVSLRIFDLSGRKVTTLVDWELTSGMHSLDWDCLSETGQPLSSGLYICRIEQDGLVETTGLCVLR